MTGRPLQLALVLGSVAVGVIAGVALSPLAPTALVGRGRDGLVAQGALARALNNQPSGALSGSTGTIAIYATYRARDGTYCRVFRTFAARSRDGIACREGNQWLVRMTISVPSTASAVPSPIVNQAIATMVNGGPLDAAAEAQAGRNGWRTS